MHTTLLLVVKIGLLVLLWFFIWMTLRALRKDLNYAANPGAAAGGGAPMGYAAPHVGLAGGTSSSGFRGTRHRTNPPKSLIITSGPLTGTTLNFQGYDEITIGRSSVSTLQLEDDFASGTHARLIRRGRDWFIEDQDSRNGTWLNGQRIDQPERLAEGMEVRIGQTRVRMEQ